MKKSIFILLLASSLNSCIKSDVEAEIEEYDLRKAKLGYMKDLMEIREDLTYKERMRFVDSLLDEEKKRIKNDNNN